LIKIILITLIASAQLYGGVIEFEDKEFERFLLTQICADTVTVDGALISPDLNSDGKIGTEEAEKIVELEISDFTREFDIKSIVDLNHFPNLRKLTLIYLDSLIEFSNLNLVKLNTLLIADCRVLHHIDISNLFNLTKSIRIEGLTQLDYLNLKNGSVSDEFSLFYTRFVDYACLDSIDKEIKIIEESGAMSEGKNPTYDCNTTTNVNEYQSIDKLILFPNPTNGKVAIRTNSDCSTMLYKVSNQNGEHLVSAYAENKFDIIRIDLSNYSNGIYFITINCNNLQQTFNLVKE